MYLITSSNAFLKAVAEHNKKVEETYRELTRRLGVKPSEGRVVILVICPDEWRGHEALFDLFAECESKFRRRIDQRRIRYVSCKTMEAAKTNPNLELASFILMADEDLLGVENYPELERILPFSE